LKKSRDELPSRHRSGRDAEDAAAAHVAAHGFEILWRNVRVGALEIDLVAKKDDLVVIVEVRARGDGAFEGPLASVTRTKRQALIRASRALWRGKLKKMDDVKRVRIDVIAVKSAAEIEWIPAAITEDDA